MWYPPDWWGLADFPIDPEGASLLGGGELTFTARGTTARVVVDRAALRALAAEWRNLPAPVAAPTVMTGPDFLEAWLDTVGAAASPRVVTLRAGSRLVGVLPLVATDVGPRHGGRQVSLVGSRRPPMTDMADVCVEPGFEIALATATVELLARTASTWDSLYLGNVAAAGLTMAAVVGLMEAQRWPVATRTRAAMVLDTDGDWDEFRRGLGRSTRRLSARLRQLQAMGDVRVEMGLTGAAGAAALEQLFDVYRERWGAGNWLDDAAYRECMRRVWAAHEPPEARIAGLWLDGRPLALQLIFRQGLRDQSLMVAAGRGEATARQSPGAVLDYLVAEQAFADDTREIHLLHTVLPSKLVWTTRFLQELSIIAVSPRSRATGAASVLATEAAILGRRIALTRRRTR